MISLSCLFHQFYLHIQFTCLKLIVDYRINEKNAFCKSPLSSPSYDLYSVLDNQKALKTLFRLLNTFKVEEN